MTSANQRESPLRPNIRENSREFVDEQGRKMKTVRSMVLVSNDPLSQARGAQAVYQRLEQEIAAHGLTDEISLMTVDDVGRHDTVPMVIIYPEGVIYGPVKTDDVAMLVEEHLSKGRIASGLLAPAHELTGRIAWLSARTGTLPAG